MLQLGLERERRGAPLLTDSPMSPSDPEFDGESDFVGQSPNDQPVDGGPFDPQRSFLLAGFRSFFAEVIRLRQAAVRDPGQLVPAEITTDYTPDHGTAQAARAISLRLQHLLEQAALDAGARSGEYGASVFAEAQYVMAAVADEEFLTAEWAGREQWLGYLLERALFKTQIAGEEIFRRIDRLLATRTGVSVELASVYFMALSAGFQGQFRGTNTDTLQEYRRRLYRFIFRRDPARSGGSILPQPYEHIAAPARQTRLPVVQRWALVLGIVIVAYLVASHLVWRNVTQDLRAIHADIRKAIAESLQGEP